jgi:trk system potassium uptake protein TrkH
MDDNKEIRGARLVAGYLGFFLTLSGLIDLVPLLLLAFYPGESSFAYCFLIPGGSAIGFGFFLSLLVRKKQKGRLTRLEGSFLFVAIWIIGILIGALPWLLSGRFSFSQAVFESTSGLSTTGLSVVDVASCPHLFLFFRSFLSFIGGVGLVLILTSAMSDHSELGLYLLEGHNDRLLPNLAKSSRTIFGIYLFYVALGSGAYLIAGLSPFDAINTAMAALSTGGFSTNPASIAGYGSVAVEIITEILMLLGATNFVIHYFLLRARFKKAFCHHELAVFGVLVLAVYPVLVFAFAQEFGSVGAGFRFGTFEFISAITTTGFSSVPSYSSIPSSALFCLILLMVIGGQSGSTSGGIKQSRAAFLFFGIRRFIEKETRESNVYSTRCFHRFGEKEVITDGEISSAFSFAGLYLLILLLGSAALCLLGYPVERSFFEFASALGTVGLSIGIVSPTASNAVLWIEMIGMFLGRLEILPVFSLVAQGCKMGREAFNGTRKTLA